MADEDLSPATGEALADDELFEEYDVLFPVIPAEDDPNPPDEGGDEGLLEDIEDFAAASERTEDVDVETDEGIDVFEPAFNWDRQEFFVNVQGSAAEPLRVTGDQAIIEWVLKCLNTPRGEYAIYSEQYGTDLKALIGQPLADTILYAEAERTIREGLLVHPRITDVVIDEIRREGSLANALFVTFAFYIDNEEEPVDMQVFTT
jgi:hypothetical protein